MSRSKGKSNYDIPLPEAILNLSNIKYKSENIAQCLSIVFAKNRTKLRGHGTITLFTKSHGTK